MDGEDEADDSKGQTEAIDGDEEEVENAHPPKNGLAIS